MNRKELLKKVSTNVYYATVSRPNLYKFLTENGVDGDLAEQAQELVAQYSENISEQIDQKFLGEVMDGLTTLLEKEMEIHNKCIESANEKYRKRMTALSNSLGMVGDYFK